MQTYQPIGTVCKPPQARNLKRGSFISIHFFFLRLQSVISWACGKVTYHGRSVWQRETATSYARRQRKELEYHNPFGRHNHSDLRPSTRPHPIVPSTSPLSPSLYRTLSVQIVAGPMPGFTFIPSVAVFFLALGGLLREA